MARQTGIEYLTATWNPIAMRCTPVSAGCDNCWHQAMARRMAGMPQFSEEIRAAYAGEGGPVLIQSRLEQPLRWQKSERIGVQFMGDLFHPDVPNKVIAAVFGVMALATAHTFVVLTKRPGRMLEWFRWVESTVEDLKAWPEQEDLSLDANIVYQCVPRGIAETVDWDLPPWPQPWPLPNVILGVSVENQSVVQRVVHLLDTPAVGRWVSVEPMLGPVDLTDLSVDYDGTGIEQVDALYFDGNIEDDHRWHGATVDWVVVGGETGPGARPTHPDWVRSIRDQCQAAGVPFFFKSWGEWAEPIAAGLRYGTYEDCPYDTMDPIERRRNEPNVPIWRVGRKAAGNRLDGRTWEQLPEVTEQ